MNRFILYSYITLKPNTLVFYNSLIEVNCGGNSIVINFRPTSIDITHKDPLFIVSNLILQ